MWTIPTTPPTFRADDTLSKGLIYAWWFPGAGTSPRCLLTGAAPLEGGNGMVADVRGISWPSSYTRLALSPHMTLASKPQSLPIEQYYNGTDDRRLSYSLTLVGTPLGGSCAVNISNRQAPYGFNLSHAGSISFTENTVYSHYATNYYAADNGFTTNVARRKRHIVTLVGSIANGLPASVYCDGQLIRSFTGSSETDGYMGGIELGQVRREDSASYSLGSIHESVLYHNRPLSSIEVKNLHDHLFEHIGGTGKKWWRGLSVDVSAVAEPDLVEILVSPQTLTVSGSATAEPTLRGIYLSPCDVPGEYYPPEYFPPDYFCFPSTEPFNLATGGATVSLADVSIPVIPLDPEALVSVIGEAGLAELEVIPQDPTAAVGITAEVEESSLTVTPQDPTATGKAEVSPELGEITVSPLDPEFAVDVTANPEIGVLEVLSLDVTASGTSPITANPELAELVVTPLDVTASGATASIAEPEEAELLISPLDAEAIGEAFATLDPVEILVSPQDPSASGASPITASPELAELLVTPQDVSAFAEALVDLDETGLVVTAYDPSADVGTIARPLIGSLLVEAQDPGVEANAEIGLDAAEIQLTANDPTAFVSITASLDLLSLLIDPEELSAFGFAEIELADVSIPVQAYDPLADGQTVTPGTANPGLATLEVTPQSITTAGYASVLLDPVSILCAVYDPSAQGETHVSVEANPEFLALEVQPYDPLADGQVISPGVANPGSVDLVISLPDLEVTGSAVAQLGELTITISAWDPAASGETHIPAEANPGLADVQIQPWGPKATGNITLNYYENMIASWGQIVIPAGTVGEFLWPVYLVDVIEENPATEVDIHPLISINGRPYQDAVNTLQPLQGEPGSYLLKLDPSELPPYGNVRILVNSEAIKAFKSTVAVVAWSPDNNSEAGEIPVDHSYGEKDGLQFVDEQGNPIAGASIQVYRAEDYASNQISPPYVQGRSQTGLDGRWVAPVMLFPGEYQVVFSDQFKHSISAALVVVE